jgi:CheY-like chemotaxis protein
VLAQKRVLIVDDEDDARELLRHILETCGVEVLDAQSVGDALTALESSHFDAIVSDIGMPERDGYSLIREVRALPRRAAIPAIALTAFTRREDEARALREGFDLHMGKPFDSAQLLAAIAGLVQQPRPPRTSRGGAA